MPASEAQIRANRENSKRSSGPATDAGKQVSRTNSYKHGMTATVVLPEREAIEVERRFVAFCEELQPSGEVGQALVRHAATMSVRMERCFDHENAVLADRVRQAEADFLAPEGVDEARAAKLRVEAGKRALFDASPEAILARKYEAAAERSFLRTLKELRQIERAAKEDREAAIDAQMASFLPGDDGGLSDPEFETLYAQTMARVQKKPADRPESDAFATLRGRVDVPISAGKRR
jgi:hypothetical protein